jgi:hypothetical protein
MTLVLSNEYLSPLEISLWTKSQILGLDWN